MSHCNAWVHAAAAKLLQSCPTLCDPIDGSHKKKKKKEMETPTWPALTHRQALNAILFQTCKKVTSKLRKFKTLEQAETCF